MDHFQFWTLLICIFTMFISIVTGFWVIINLIIQTKDKLSEKMDRLDRRLGHVESFLEIKNKGFEAKTGTE